MDNKRFATAINCMDGRVQFPVGLWLKSFAGVDYIDVITEPGVDRLMAEGPSAIQEAIRQKVLISVNGHGSRVVAVVGHGDCAGNPATKDEHLAQVAKAVATIRGWNLPVRIVGVWVNEAWEVEVVGEEGTEATQGTERTEKGQRA